jgi:enoyl-CoA hydratase/carnithine racemase/DNA-binding response OmpR family regulator
MDDGLRAARILVVDDEIDVCETVEDVLAGEVWEVVPALSWEEATSALERGGFDAAVIDLMGVRGLELLERFGARLPCLVLTGHALSPQTLKQAIELKARAYVPKGQMSELVSYLRIVLSAPATFDLWQIWLHRRLDLLNLRTHLGEDFEKADTDFFESVATGSRAHQSLGQLIEHEGGVFEVRHCEPPLNLYTPGSILLLRKLMERLREEPACRAILHTSGLPPGLPPQAAERLARRLPLRWLPRSLAESAARLALRVLRPRLQRSVLFGAGIALETSLDPALVQAILEFGRDVFLDMFYYPKPYVVVLEGAAIAGGMELALSSHYLVGDGNAALMLPEMRLGFTPPAGIPLMMQRVGAQRAFALAADARLVTAREAARLGLLDRLTPVGQARAVGLKTARTLADRQAVAGLQMARGLMGFDMREAMDRSFREWQRLMGTPVARAHVERFFAARGRALAAEPVRPQPPEGQRGRS